MNIKTAIKSENLNDEAKFVFQNENAFIFM